jgi:cytochrome c oxidase assembly protein subunit 15
LANQQILSRAAYIASFFALGVIALGAFTRLIDAGLGCPDWPGCYGHLIVPLSKTTTMVAYKAWAEMIHRYFVGGLSLFILAIVVMVFLKKICRTRANVLLSLGLILLLAYQIMLGQWTVTLKLLPIIVTQHLLGGFGILALLWLLYLNNNLELRHHLKPVSIGVLLPAAWVALVLLLIQIILGAWTSTHYAAFSCPAFPFCKNHQDMMWHWRQAFTVFTTVGINYAGGILSEGARQTIQMTHRLGALIVTLYLFIFAVSAMLVTKKSPALIQSFYAIVGLLCIQLCLGITNVMLKLPLVTAVSHTLVAALLLLAILGLIFKLTVIRSNT